jgi:hypothetical protein
VRMFDTTRMRKRPDRVRRQALAAQPAVKRDRWLNVVHERMGWTYLGEPGASHVVVCLHEDSPGRYGMTREMFDSMSDEEFASRMETEQGRWSV